MAKHMNQVTVTVKSGNTEATYTAPDAQISGNGDQYHPSLSINLYDYKAVRMNTNLNKPESPLQAQLTAHEKLVADHAKVISDVLQDAETARLTSALKRETLEAEIAAQERADKMSLTFAVHNAIQAGLDMEEVTASMRDDYAGYVSDMADQVYLGTDLDTLVNVS